ncbi:hypothetical protein SAMN00768000_1313 [Sulfobacillus thermosulfidooxidans DSM 9293]|uniref:Glycolipid-binding domain-containing protein n=1 Tax=Sulfobacillus thermosulfidooxidans (strain DSM 9293 / VKM B-1269 / AT-1) TaxID=929705 RepID=A0A1W1WC36_SULTA|nr:putative glycolipid-binding domain-containing protein [Sulfobacillus thermosulfidooxidans]SMC03856.1 hypothetical protein SAMN00768000_1313 [Sulfobacillus thermosulfidooxidans DSM 9293]
MYTVLWSSFDGAQKEYCLVKDDPVLGLRGQIISSGTADNPEPLWVSYEVECFENGMTRLVKVFSRGAEGQGHTLHLTHYPNGPWFANSQLLPDCDGLDDVDLGITPSTNMLAIRRLDLALEQSRDISVLWIRFPDLHIEILRQRYTSIGTYTYRYESLNSGYQADLVLSPLGIITQYGNLWTGRIWPDFPHS